MVKLQRALLVTVGGLVLLSLPVFAQDAKEEHHKAKAPTRRSSYPAAPSVSVSASLGAAVC
jgi:hypothetical protein